MKNIVTNIRVGINTVRSEEFKRAVKIAVHQLDAVNKLQSIDLNHLKRAYIEQKRSIIASYDKDRKKILLGLFDKSTKLFKQEKIKHLLNTEAVETVFD